MNEDEYEIENSPLSQKFSQDAMTIEICIYRGKGDAGWILEVVDQEGASTVWDDPFPSDRAAWEEVMATIAKEGIASFLTNDGRQVH
jgi:hypothetical protein